MKERIITIYRNDTDISKKTKKLFRQKLEGAGFTVTDELNEKSELIVTIGGDGVFLTTLHEMGFPDIPFIGINTGHLGFFQEFSPKQLDEFIFSYEQGRYSLQVLNTVKGTVACGRKKTQLIALNDIVCKAFDSRSIHLNISIDGSFVERFSGDGVVVSTAAGSTAYNYSLGGSIVDPRLKLLQLTPMAPMNTIAYRSFTSSVLLPSNSMLEIVPEKERAEKLIIACDGIETVFEAVDSLRITSSRKQIKLLRFEGYDFWDKVKTKFL